MGLMTRIAKSIFLSASRCRRMSSSSSSSSSLFLVNRFSEETSNHYFSLISSETGASVRDFHSPNFGGPETLLSRCKGLVRMHHGANNEQLWNPWTNQFKLIPPSYVPRPANKAGYLFDDGSFGFDPKSQDYKIIRLVRNYFNPGYTGPCVLQLELYSLRNDSWKELEILYDDPCFKYFSRTFSYGRFPDSELKAFIQDFSRGLSGLDFGSYANGCCYWRTGEENILSFDFATERFAPFSFPDAGRFEYVRKFDWNDDADRQSKHTIKLLEFDGLFGAIVYAHKYELSLHQFKLEGELWVWDNQSWTRKFEINVAGTFSGKFLGFSGDNRFLFLFEKSLHGLHQVWMYEVGTQQVIKKFDNHDIPPSPLGPPCPSGIIEVSPYFDSKVDFN